MRTTRILAGALGCSLGGLAVAAPAEARITAIEVTAIEPFAEGAAWGEAGAYERVVGTARGELDPADPANAGIVDLVLAPRNAAGMVEYATDLFLLRPKDPARGSGTLLFEVPNRGRKFLFNWIMDARPAAGLTAINDPRSAADAGTGLSLRRGDTLVWAGWEANALRQQGGMAIDLPVATRNGRPITEWVRDELVSATRGPPEAPFFLAFEATQDVVPDPDDAPRLTVKRREPDAARPVPPQAWRLAGPRQVELLPKGTKPGPGTIYQLAYRTTGPKVQGIGFAAVRDVVAHLRTGTEAGTIRHTVALGISQSGRYLRDFIHLGFNRDESGRRVFDGVLAHIAGAGGIFLNARFAQPSRTNTQHEDHLYPENAFPFSAAMQHDPVTGRRGSLLRGDASDPLLIEVNTSTEYWQKGASLLTTDPLGRADVALPDKTRAYLIASGFHNGRAHQTNARGACLNPRSTLSSGPALRALLVALEEWVATGRAPPESRVPRVADGTLVAPEAIGFPYIPGVPVPGAVNAVARFSTYLDPRPEAGPQYRPLVPRVDADGHEVAGIRLPAVAAPRATYTGWNLYADPYPTGVLCDRDGSEFALARTRAEREASGDPRPSLEERYPDKAAYAAAVAQAADALVAERLLLREDADRMSAAAQGEGP
ncbi:alpha/beta hydrolase domain-containing protein [uncultured Methylobacterium sp.]|uniref:alpha/beta hydrolase domain-containing protein n=1 Tax=uncultured Methylobacterium sp. TaxID=157278 RepID=UPI00259481B1|nr:alpha/beta hydrolase domain-containing protein [uncultured Methylobacterium sp.]